MWTIAFTLLKKFWPYVLVGLIILFGWLYVVGLQNKVESLTKDKQALELKVQEKVREIQRLQGQLDDCANANRTFQEEITKFNESISAWSEASTKQLQEFDKLKKDIITQQANNATRIKTILNNPNKPKTCEEAIQYLIEVGKKIK